MPQNNQPIFTIQGNHATDNSTTTGPTLTTAAADYTGAGANNALVFTADATDGSYVRSVRLSPIGTNVASVARFYINNGSANTTAGNNVYIGGISLQATTATATAAEPIIEFPVNMKLEAGWRIYCGLGTTVAAGWRAFAVAEDY